MIDEGDGYVLFEGELGKQCEGGDGTLLTDEERIACGRAKRPAVSKRSQDIEYCAFGLGGQPCGAASLHVDIEGTGAATSVDAMHVEGATQQWVAGICWTATEHTELARLHGLRKIGRIHFE